MTISDDNLDMQLRTNNGLLANIWDALRKEAALRSLDLGSLSIKVQNGEVYLDGYLKEENLPQIEYVIYSVVGVVEVHNHLRTDDGIQADIWNAVWREDTIRSLDLGSLSIDVKGGEVYLYGYLGQEDNLLRIKRITHSIEAIVAVHSHLVIDRDLSIQVAQALACNERTRLFILPIYASHGWIHIRGEVPTHDIQHDVEKMAAEVPEVRGVITLPRVIGEIYPISQRAVQPHIGAAVHGKNGEVGVVTQVVIQPNNRLVTHVVVRSKQLRDIHLITIETVVPLEAIARVNQESILLVRNTLPLQAYPSVDPNEYVLAPSAWKAPYPYTEGEVLWPLREIVEDGCQSRSKPAINRGVEQGGTAEKVMDQDQFTHLHVAPETTLVFTGSE